jgi:ABC-type branched-subunit amino acid transport system ATPase component
MRYGGFCALESLDLDVHVGEICALLGPNGAGKEKLDWLGSTRS